MTTEYVNNSILTEQNRTEQNRTEQNRTEQLNVLSLFDGISCGMVALERASIKVGRYYASEIEKAPIQISHKNYPDIIQLGDVTKITKSDIENLGRIDLVIGGSPCQGLSNVNVTLKDGEYGVNGTGKSRLFWEYVRILKTVQQFNPEVWFLFENVGSAKNNDKRIISDAIGEEPISINSQMFSAQYRNRLYWTNIPVEIPTERINVSMSDILEESVPDKYYLSEKMRDYIMADATGNWRSGKKDINLQIARPLLATMHKMHRADTDNYVSTDYHPFGKTNIRKLTPLECERLQTLPDQYTAGVCDTERYKAIGNGWTVDVIAHIFKGLEG